jgi:hypothetical protein
VEEVGRKISNPFERARYFGHGTPGFISKGLGGYLEGQSQVEHYDKEVKQEFSEIERTSNLELTEIQDVQSLE